MAKKQSVDAFLADLQHRRKADIETLRRAILDADRGITEQVKWNAPSFCWRGEDRVTMRLQPGDRLELIFHRGAKPKDASTFTFDDPHGLIQWAARDRGMLALATLERLSDVIDLIRRWMRETD